MQERARTGARSTHDFAPRSCSYRCDVCVCARVHSKHAVFHKQARTATAIPMVLTQTTTRSCRRVRTTAIGTRLGKRHIPETSPPPCQPREAPPYRACCGGWPPDRYESPRESSRGGGRYFGQHDSLALEQQELPPERWRQEGERARGAESRVRRCRSLTPRHTRKCTHVPDSAHRPLPPRARLHARAS